MVLKAGDQHAARHQFGKAVTLSKVGLDERVTDAQTVTFLLQQVYCCYLLQMAILLVGAEIM